MGDIPRDEGSSVASLTRFKDLSLNGVGTLDVNKLDKIVRGLRKNDFEAGVQLAHVEEGKIIRDNMGQIVSKFFTGTKKDVLTLIQFSINFPYISNQCYLISALFDELRVRNLLESEHALHLYAHAKHRTEVEPNWPKLATQYQKLCTNVLDELNKNKGVYFKIYEKYVEDPNKTKIEDLHKSNWHLCSIFADFVPFYYNGDLARAKKLIEAARAVNSYDAAGRILLHLFKEMEKREKMYAQEAFELLDEAKRYRNFNNYKEQSLECKKAFEDLKVIDLR